jgi:hypothetical protein
MRSRIVTLAKSDPEFYPLLGPFLASRAVAAAVGGPIWDDDGKTWHVALDGDAVAGFIATRTARGLAHVESCYTVPGHEAERPRLIRAALDATHPSPAATSVRREFVSAYLKAGFVQTAETRNFVKLARKA